MNIISIRDFFKWCAIVNGIILLISALGLAVFPTAALAVHASLFQIPAASVTSAIYLLLGIYKVLWLMLNVVPYFTLRIMTHDQEKLNEALAH